jgi:hypothetical protein
MPENFEATGNVSDWPPNEHGKPTQAVVFGVAYDKRGLRHEILWTGQFPDLEPAMYWAAKKEIEAIRKGDWDMASRILWQHELTPEKAVEAIVKQMTPQLEAALRRHDAGGDFDLGAGMMQPVRPQDVENYYVEITPKDDPNADPIASFIAPPPVDNDVPVQWVDPPPKPEDN